MQPVDSPTGTGALGACNPASPHCFAPPVPNPLVCQPVKRPAPPAPAPPPPGIKKPPHIVTLLVDGAANAGPSLWFSAFACRFTALTEDCCSQTLASTISGATTSTLGSRSLRQSTRWCVGQLVRFVELLLLVAELPFLPLSFFHLPPGEGRNPAQPPPLVYVVLAHAAELHHRPVPRTHHWRAGRHRHQPDPAAVHDPLGEAGGRQLRVALPRKGPHGLAGE
eukprot:SAG22_NODE_359_length_11758_cov_4.094254_13_plen_223_part_00